jgi:hypothetical protein
VGIAFLFRRKTLQARLGTVDHGFLDGIQNKKPNLSIGLDAIYF